MRTKLLAALAATLLAACAGQDDPTTSDYVSALSGLACEPDEASFIPLVNPQPVPPLDLVGISVDSKTARRSYDIAAAYRRRGVKPVVR